jgi:hypothetical protein
MSSFHHLTKITLCIMLFYTLIAQMAAPASAAPKQVGVRIPSFNVELNGVKIDNEHQEYPLLVYKDITYFPMTWDFSRALSLSVN